MSSVLKQNAFKIIIFSLMLLPLAIYWQTGSLGFVGDDESSFINENNFPRQNPSANFEKFWTPSKTEMYAPITYSFWSIISSFRSSTLSKQQKFDAKPFHLFNVFIHIINGFLVFFILSRLIKNYWFAWFGAMVFVMHPIQIESVVRIAHLAGLLSGMFGFMSVYYFMNFRNPPQATKHIHSVKSPKQKQEVVKQSKITNPNYYLIVSIAALVLSMLSKPSGVAFVFLILLIDIFHFKTEIKKVLPPIGIMIITTIPISLIAIGQESKVVEAFVAPLWQRPIAFIETIFFYIFNLVFPVNLSSTIGSTTSFLAGSPLFYISAGLVLAIALLLYIYRKKDRGFLFAFLLFVVGYLPVLGLETFGFQHLSTIADRYLYASMLGAGLAFGLLLEKFNTQKSAAIFGLAIIGIMTIITFSQIPI